MNIHPHQSAPSLNALRFDWNGLTLAVDVDLDEDGYIEEAYLRSAETFDLAECIDIVDRLPDNDHGRQCWEKYPPVGPLLAMIDRARMRVDLRDAIIGAFVAQRGPLPRPKEVVSWAV